MALKDLIADKAAIAEEQIEEIVGPYARYDVESKEVAFLPPFAGLSNKVKILVYLTALQGWQFVVAQPAPASSSRPAEIEKATGIPGGSLRPLLRDLCDNHILTENDSHYSIRATSLPTVKSELGQPVGDSAAVRSTPRRPQRKVSKAPNTSQATPIDSSAAGNPEGEAKKRSRKTAGKTGNVAARFERMIDEGFFNEPRTFADVKKRLHRDAIMVSRTSLPGYLLAGVRKGLLSRDEIEVEGKSVWAYSTIKKPS